MGLAHNKSNSTCRAPWTRHHHRVTRLTHGNKRPDQWMEQAWHCVATCHQWSFDSLNLSPKLLLSSINTWWLIRTFSTIWRQHKNFSKDEVRIDRGVCIQFQAFSDPAG